MFPAFAQVIVTSLARRGPTTVICPQTLGTGGSPRRSAPERFVPVRRKIDGFSAALR